MVKIDLITGFLGAGKTTFIRKYAEYLMDKGLSIGILENDYGAVNVDMMLLQDMSGDNCELEMVAGGCDYDCQCHTLDEQFKVEDAFKGCQQTLLMTLLCAGTEMTESII